MKRKKKLLVIFCPIAAVLLALGIFLIVWYCGASYPQFGALARAEFEIPGLSEGVCPQGLCALPENEAGYDFAMSGYLSEGASRVYLIDEEGEAETDAPSTRVELVVAKHRNGPLGDIPMDWVGEIVRFREADPYSLAITKQFNENKRAKKEKEEAKAAAERNGLEGADFPPDEPPPETEGTVIDGEIL